MKKRLISLVMALAMMISTVAVLTGCSDEGNTASEATIKPMTITLAMITDDETTPAGIKLVEDAINRITENELKVHVVLQLYTADEYDAAIEAKIQARLAYRSENKTDLSSIGSDEDKVVNKYGREVTQYPEPYDNQIDIFLLNGVNNLEKYTEYPKYGVDLDALKQEFEADPGNADKEFEPAPYVESVLAPLDTYLTDGSANLITKYISTNLINNCKIGETLYAIPSNGFYGNSEYLVINRALFDKYSYDIEDVTSDISTLEDFLTDIANKEYVNGIKPLYNYGSMGLLSVTGKNSPIAAWVPEGADPANAWVPSVITGVSEFTAALTSINNFASINDDYPVVGTDLSEAEDGKFAAGYVTADALGIAEYEEDYYTVLTRKAMATTEQVYDNAFAVFKYASDTARCAQLIEMIQTNRELHNLLLYGVENMTYTVDEDTGLVSRKHEGTDGAVYVMDENLCGNLFISLPNDEMDVAALDASANDWAKAKEASRNIFYSPYMGFQLDLITGVEEDYKPSSDTFYQPSAGTVDTLESLYNQLFDKIAEYPEEHEARGVTFQAYLAEMNSWLNSVQTEGGLIYAQLLTSTTNLTIVQQYYNWWRPRYQTAAA